MKSFFQDPLAIVTHAMKSEENDANYYRKILKEIMGTVIQDPTIEKFISDMERMERNHRIKLGDYLRGIITFTDLMVKEIDGPLPEVKFDIDDYFEKLMYDAFQNEILSEERYIELSEMARNIEAMEMFRRMAKEERLHQIYIADMVIPIYRKNNLMAG